VSVKASWALELGATTPIPLLRGKTHGVKVTAKGIVEGGSAAATLIPSDPSSVSTPTLTEPAARFAGYVKMFTAIRPSA
jgi:hypothetical protein